MGFITHYHNNLWYHEAGANPGQNNGKGGFKILKLEWAYTNNEN